MNEVKLRLEELEAQDPELAQELCESFGWNGETVTTTETGDKATPMEWFAQVLWEATDDGMRDPE